MRICVVHLGDICDCFVASSVNRGLVKKYNNAEITWIVQGDEQCSLFEFSDVTAKKMSDILQEPIQKYDLLVNFSPHVHPSDPVLSADRFVGFNLNSNSKDYYNIIYGNSSTKMNWFQVYFRLAELAWKGESYGITYFPKSKTRKDIAGVAIDHAKLRHYVNDHIEMDMLRMMLVPYKKNIFKRMDEINKASYVITDDQLTMHIGIFLRKYVHFLETMPMNARPEFFGKGKIYKVPSQIVK